MNNDEVPVRNDEFQLEEIDGELLLYHAGKTETLFLNESAAMIWYLCDGERSVADIYGMLQSSYPEQKESLLDDVQESIARFEEFGGITSKTG